LQDNYNALHIAAMHSREDIVKILLSKKGVDPFASGGVSKGNSMTGINIFGTNSVVARK
jgi:ankyrin repeat protein